MANADIKYLNFSALINSTTGAPSLYFDISFSENFSDALSLQLLYWKINEQQTWITIKRDQASGSFIKTIELPIFAVSGKYAIRAISIFENTGINVSLMNINWLSYSLMLLRIWKIQMLIMRRHILRA